LNLKSGSRALALMCSLRWSAVLPERRVSRDEWEELSV
jgi:hypothetical protein